MIEEGVLDGLPDPETIDAVINAIGQISGKSVVNLRKRIMEECYFPLKGMCYELGEYKALPMTAMKLKLKELEKRAIETHYTTNQEEARLQMAGLKLIQLFFKARESLTGVGGAQVCSRLCQAGILLEGLGEVFDMLPSFEEFNAEQQADSPLIKTALRETVDAYGPPGPDWLDAYLKSIQELVENGGGEINRPSTEYLTGLRDDFSELIDVVKAAMPYLDSVHREAFPMPPEMVKSIEDEARYMFGIIE